MSLRVLIIPEDHRKDQYFLAPVLSALFADLGKPNAKIQVCQEIIGGVSKVTNHERIKEILEIYAMVDLYLVCVDRDCEVGRRSALDSLEKFAESILRRNQKLLAQCAWEELEVWLLAGLDLNNEWNWQDIRSDCHPKENYFEVHSKQAGLIDFPAEGRGVLGDKAKTKVGAIKQKCPEFEEFARRIQCFFS